MASPFDNVAAASLPTTGLAGLAGLRTHTSVRAASVADRWWLSFPAGDAAVLRILVPIAGVRLYERRANAWFLFGRHLPSFDFPEKLEQRPLTDLLFPDTLRPRPVPTGVPVPLPLALVAEHRSRPATAARCRLGDVAGWADTVPTARLEMLEAAYRDDEILLRGRRLPPLAQAQLYWGNTLLLPNGWRVEPNVPESIARAAFGIEIGELLLWDHAGVEGLPETLLQPLTRAGLRLALAERVP